MSDNKQRIQTMILCPIFAGLVAMGAFIKIPLVAVPITLQLFFTLLTAFILGSKRGAISLLLYITIGLLGVPVFTAGGGFGYVLKPSFGYLMGFALGVFLAGLICDKAKKRTVWTYIIATASCTISVYTIGLPYFYFICNVIGSQALSLKYIFTYCYAVFIPGNLITSTLAIILAMRLVPILEQQNLLPAKW